MEISAYKGLFEENGIALSAEQAERLEKYADMLVEYNNMVNLTAITDDEGIAVKHFLDSIYPFTLFDLPEGVSMIDVGTGAGFPSCPLKVYRGDIRLTLLDSLNKRVNFLQSLSDTIGLDAECVHGRAEEFGKKDEYRESFDIATARAVANLTDLCEYCLPFVKVGGLFVSLKGSSGSEELDKAKPAIKLLGGKTEKVVEYTLPGGDGRTLILIRKVSPTPAKYPRNAGQMKKRSLS
ncbi:16S rRNA (guanine(527)-N(7))-methyltransferase RsmG [Ruminococcus albus]|uniref:Ribosomal RNA small subunit methyltransferase G n=1 Tax=Ruminococcus albus (strain ATCC 27210 / DSM 20455 / JCM 14654 / NCDO 2250 / 7) TaxID=697329 RepID=E6UBD9_RUMA7|nr:16S rRNA (guanine(527)-N(7))-methyltransferase RsmG [Ruminococcus albus]ADU21489.1 methyltransferase GidB [Ruminococcus albus 7 = DSM 20455]